MIARIRYTKYGNMFRISSGQKWNFACTNPMTTVVKTHTWLLKNNYTSTREDSDWYELWTSLTDEQRQLCRTMKKMYDEAISGKLKPYEPSEEPLDLEKLKDFVRKSLEEGGKRPHFSRAYQRRDGTVISGSAKRLDIARENKEEYQWFLDALEFLSLYNKAMKEKNPDRTFMGFWEWVKLNYGFDHSSQ